MLRPLPIISNQNFNKYLKELCKDAGIDEQTEIIRYKEAEKISNFYPELGAPQLPRALDAKQSL